MVWVHDQARLISDDAGEPMYWQGVLVDITEQMRAQALEADLASERQTAHELREADELKNTFLQAVAHDLRSPLTAILGLSGTLEREEVDLDRDETRDFARRITANAQRLDRLVTDMLDLERLAGGVLRPVLLPLDLGALVRESGRELRARVASAPRPRDRPSSRSPPIARWSSASSTTC